MNTYPNFDELGRNFAIALHDAGATNLLIGWLKSNTEIRFKPWISGPAKQLWDRAFPHSCYSDRDSFLEGVDGLICGTGWASNLEFDAMQLALAAGLPTYAVVDHWVNYEQRFMRNGYSIRPTEIWVSDVYAESKALSTFPLTKIQRYENIYLKNQVLEIKAAECSIPRTSKTKILYIAEPIRCQWAGFEKRSPEFQALDYFLSKLPKLHIGNDVEIRIRLHPSESIDKYIGWVKEKNSVNNQICLDQHETLAQSIAWSNLVVGCHSFAMVVALETGRRVYSSIPPWGGETFLPYKNIIQISKIDKN